MAYKKLMSQHEDEIPSHRTQEQDDQSPVMESSEATPNQGVQRDKLVNAPLNATKLLQLQRSVGNRAIGKLLLARENTSSTIQRDTINASLNTSNPRAGEVGAMDKVQGKTYIFNTKLPEIGITHRELASRFNFATILGTDKYTLSTPDGYIVNYGAHQIQMKGPGDKQWTINIRLNESEKEGYAASYTPGPISGDRGTMSAEMHRLAYEEYGVDDVTLVSALSKLTSSSGAWNTIRTVNANGIISELKLSRMKGANKRFFARSESGGKVTFTELGDHL
ncbi:MAG TPA: hypothetical protein VH186_27050 [Chloroflexia bacterium]|nr:hypothetical protein [Chloroflexia bacterium]